MSVSPIWLAAVSVLSQGSQDAHERIRQAVETHCGRQGSADRDAMADRLDAMLRRIPPDPELREKCVHQIVRMLEMSMHLLPRDAPYKALRSASPELPELVLPDAFHLRAYELTERTLSVMLQNAAAYPARAHETRQQISSQIEALCAEARQTLLAKAVGPTAEVMAREVIDAKLNQEFRPALDSPFNGYLSPLDPGTYEEVRRRIVERLASLPYVELGNADASSTIPESASVTRDGRAAVAALTDAVKVMYQIGRAFNPPRFRLDDEARALVKEAHEHWREAEARLGAPYHAKWGEERSKAGPATSDAVASGGSARPNPAEKEEPLSPAPDSRPPLPAAKEPKARSPVAAGIGVAILAALAFGAWKWARGAR